jgi:hypothetical protein
VADWVTISSLATAGGTLVLAVATFSSVRSSNRSARVAERALQAGLRPLLMPSHMEDPPQKVGFVDDHWVMVPGGGGSAEASDAAIYLTLSVRNVGSGMAVLHGWRLVPELLVRGGAPSVEDFHRLSRDLYVPVGDVGFWQGAFRDRESDDFRAAADAIASRQSLTVDILYGDHEGGQRVISRFLLRPRGEGEGWIATTARHWNIYREDPR